MDTSDNNNIILLTGGASKLYDYIVKTAKKQYEEYHRNYILGIPQSAANSGGSQQVGLSISGLLAPYFDNKNNIAPQWWEAVQAALEAAPNLTNAPFVHSKIQSGKRKRASLALRSPTIAWTPDPATRMVDPHYRGKRPAFVTLFLSEFRPNMPLTAYTQHEIPTPAQIKDTVNHVVNDVQALETYQALKAAPPTEEEKAIKAAMAPDMLDPRVAKMLALDGRREFYAKIAVDENNPLKDRLTAAGRLGKTFGDEIEKIIVSGNTTTRVEIGFAGGWLPERLKQDVIDVEPQRQQPTAALEN